MLQFVFVAPAAVRHVFRASSPIDGRFRRRLVIRMAAFAQRGSAVALGARGSSNVAVAEFPSIQDLLQRWHAGDQQALEQLVAWNLPWLRQHVERRLGGFLRERGDVGDYLHDALLDFLRDGPRFQVRDEAQFRGLLVRVIENTLRDKNDWFRAKRRNLGRVAPMPADSVLDLHSGIVVSSTPSRQVAREESRAWVRLALELLDPEDRKVILGRDYEDRSFVEIGEELGLSAAAVRMRWTRAVGRLAQTMLKLRAGEVAGLDLDERDGPARDDRGSSLP